MPGNASWISIRNPLAPKEAKPEFDIGEPELVTNIERASVIYADGSESEIPSEQSQMNYYFVKTKLSDGRTLDSVAQTVPLPDVQLGKTQVVKHQFDPFIQIIPPDEYFFRA